MPLPDMNTYYFITTYLFRICFIRDQPYYEQHFIVSTGIDCRLRATIYVRITERKVLSWIQVSDNLYLYQGDKLSKTRGFVVQVPPHG